MEPKLAQKDDFFDIFYGEFDFVDNFRLNIRWEVSGKRFEELRLQSLR